MGSSTQTSTSTSGPSNPAVSSLITKLSTGLGNEYTPGKSLYQAPGATTQQGWQQSLTQAGNPAFANGVNGAISDYADIAAGKRYGTNDPGFATLRQKAIDDSLAATNSAFNQAGVFGSDQNVKAAGQGVGDAVAGLDYQNFQNDQSRQASAAALLPQLFSAGQLPASIYQSVGASQDAAKQAQANGPTDFLAKLSSIAAGNAAAGGTTTTNSQPTAPLWQQILGLGISAL